MEKIAICVPTYNRADVVNELIIKCLPYIKETGFDLYIFDSSDNDRTSQVCSESAYKDDFTYIRMDSAIHSNAKVYMIYKNENLLADYDYIWIWSDSIRWSRSVLTQIAGLSEYDLVILNSKDKENIGTKDMSSIQEIFDVCAWVITLYGATIVNTKTILKGIDWNIYEEKYLTPQCINFSHVGMFFERIAEMGAVNARYYSFKPYEFSASALKESSGWEKAIFKVWWERWYDTIIKLPEVYKNKDAVIKKHGVYSGFFTSTGMLRLKLKGKYKLSVFFRYIKRIPYITNVPLICMFLIAALPVGVCRYILYRPQKLLRQDLKHFSEQYKDLYIYGCGYNAKVVVEYMRLWNVDFKCFCVSDITNSAASFMDKRVIEYDDALLEDENTGIIIGMNENNSSQVMEAKFRDTEKRKRVFLGFNEYWENLY